MTPTRLYSMRPELETEVERQPNDAGGQASRRPGTDTAIGTAAKIARQLSGGFALFGQVTYEQRSAPFVVRIADTD